MERALARAGEPRPRLRALRRRPGPGRRALSRGRSGRHDPASTGWSMRQVLAPQQVAPGRWLLPRLPPSDPAAPHRLATDCRELEVVLGRVGRDAQCVVAHLRRRWTGPSAAAAPAPLAQLVQDLTTVRRALCQLADELDRLAAALHRASREHDWSWRKAAAIGAVVAVSAGAVVVSVASAGTATPGAAAAETAAPSAAAGGLAAASA